jgi:hypothetical protein
MTRALLALIATLASGCLTPQVRLGAPGGFLLAPSHVYGNPTLCKFMVGSLVGGIGGAVLLDTDALPNGGMEDALSVLSPIALTVGAIGSAGCLGQYVMRGKHRTSYKPPNLSAEDKERLRAHESTLHQGPAAPVPDSRTAP